VTEIDSVRVDKKAITVAGTASSMTAKLDHCLCQRFHCLARRLNEIMNWITAFQLSHVEWMGPNMANLHW